MLQGHGEKNVVKKIPSKIFFYYLEKFGTGEELDFRCLNFYLTLGKWFLRQNSRHVPRTVTRSLSLLGQIRTLVVLSTNKGTVRFLRLLDLVRCVYYVRGLDQMDVM